MSSDIDSYPTHQRRAAVCAYEQNTCDVCIDCQNAFVEHGRDEVAALRDALRVSDHNYRQALAERDALRAELQASQEAGDNALADIIALRADAVKRTSELHTWKETATTLRAANDKLVTALAEVRPVVQAACEERDLSSLVSDDFRDAVDAFRAAQQETTAHHESNDDLADLCDPTGESDDVMGAKHGE